MIDKYKKWIDENIKTYNDALGNCYKTCVKMRREFPELKMIRGWYKIPNKKKQTHWWLETVDGLIIDPTLIQYSEAGKYIPFKIN